jgi:hypothetical protein
MSKNDDDILTAPVPEPDDEPTAAERAHAKTFADLVDKTLSGRTPPAMSADDRALLEVATVIRAASGNLELPAAKQRTVIEDALRQAIGGNVPSSSLSTTPITRARSRRLPWVIATSTSLVAAAAIVMLWVRTGTKPTVVGPAAGPRKQSVDALVGQISPERAYDAATRADAIFADRLDLYRERWLSGKRGGKR